MTSEPLTGLVPRRGALHPCKGEVMIVIDPSALAEARAGGVCEDCGKRARLDAHHLWTRGAGGGSRLDVPLNLAGVCRQCHDLYTSGAYGRERILAFVATREGCLQHELEMVVQILMRAPKDAGEVWFRVETDDWPCGALALLWHTLDGLPRRRESA